MKLFSKKYELICDIDGTISIVGDRLKYIEQEKKDYDSFYNSCGEDLPNVTIINMVKCCLKIMILYFVLVEEKMLER